MTNRFSLRGEFKIITPEYHTKNQVCIQGASLLLDALSALDKRCYITHIGMLSSFDYPLDPEAVKRLTFNDIQPRLASGSVISVKDSIYKEGGEGILHLKVSYLLPATTGQSDPYMAAVLLVNGNDSSDDIAPGYQPSSEGLLAIAPINPPIYKSTFLPLQAEWHIYLEI